MQLGRLAEEPVDNVGRRLPAFFPGGRLEAEELAQSLGKEQVAVDNNLSA